MVRRPDTSDALVDTRNGFLGALQLFAAGFLEKVRLVEDLLGLEIAHADGLFASIDIVALDDGMLVWPGRDSDFNLRVGFGERW